jgi:hypothetical protein
MQKTKRFPYKFILFTVGTLITINSFAQQKDTLFSFKSIAEDNIKLPTRTLRSAEGIAIAGIGVVDMRYDTTVVGFNKFNSIKLGNGASREISNQLNASFGFDSASPDSVVLYIKTFWLGNQLGIYGANAGVDKGRWKQGLICNIECFYKKQDAYYALTRYDTTLLGPGKLEDDAVDLITTFLTRIGQKIAGSVATFNTAKTKLTSEQVAARYQSRFNVPILRDDVPRRGIYRTFSDFQNNRPSFGNYEIVTDKIVDLLYKVDSAGKPEVVRDIWGYSDGKKAFVQSENNYFALERVGNSFYLKGFKDVEIWITDDYGRPVNISNQTTGERKYSFGSGRGTKLKHKVFYKPYQLNMENGEIY